MVCVVIGCKKWGHLFLTAWKASSLAQLGCYFLLLYFVWLCKTRRCPLINTQSLKIYSCEVFKTIFCFNFRMFNRIVSTGWDKGLLVSHCVYMQFVLTLVAVQHTAWKPAEATGAAEGASLAHLQLLWHPGDCQGKRGDWTSKWCALFGIYTYQGMVQR